jgi:fatty acid elongase 3
MPNAGTCAGEEFAAFAGMGILSSYLFLFISFYIATYRKDKKPSSRKSLRRMSQAAYPDPNMVTKATNDYTNGNAKTSGARTNGATTRSRKA